MKTIVPNLRGGFVAVPGSGSTALDHFDVIAWSIETTADGEISVTPITPVGDVTTSEKHWAIWNGREWLDHGQGPLNTSTTGLLDLWKCQDDADTDTQRTPL